MKSKQSITKLDWVYPQQYIDIIMVRGTNKTTSGKERGRNRSISEALEYANIEDNVASLLKESILTTMHN